MRLPPLLAAALLLAALATTADPAPGPAAAAGAGSEAGHGPARHVAGPGSPDPQVALARAAAALAGAGAGGATARPSTAPGDDAGLALRQLFRVLPRLATTDPAGADEARGLLARPTQAASDPRGDGYSVGARRRCRGAICVHWVASTTDAPQSRAWALTTLRVARQVRRLEVDQLGYRPPRRDGSRGGDPRLDIYLSDVGARGLYGYCAPERRLKRRGGGTSGAATSYCVLDDDFARAQFAQAPLRSLRVTAAHELFHAVQFSYDVDEDPWFQESTATWMEERFADAANDNRRYLPYGQLLRPGVSLERSETTGYAQYGAWIFWQRLSEQLGDDVVREVWQRVANGPRHDPADQLDPVVALREVLAPNGGLDVVFGRYAAASLARGTSFEEGRDWPRPRVGLVRRLSPSHRGRAARVAVSRLGSARVALVPRVDTSEPRSPLEVAVAGPPKGGHATAYVVVRRGGVPHVRRVGLDTAGAGTLTVHDAAAVDRVVVVVANASLRPRPEDFRVQARLSLD